MPQSKAVAKVLASGYMLDAKAFDMISKLPPEVDVEALVDKLLEKKATAHGEPMVITQSDVEGLMPAAAPEQDPFEALKVEGEAELEVVSDPTQSIAPADTYDGFEKLFVDRYNRLSALVRGRLDTKGSSSVSSARAVPTGKKVKVAGLLTDRSSRKGIIEMRIDDPTGTMKLVCQDPLAEKAALEAPLDSMVVVEMSRSKSGQLFAGSVVLPDVPGRKPISSSHRVYAVLLSDLHIGSKKFLAEDFKRFLQWLNGAHGDLDLVNRIRYLVIAGDLVDGVGVYPGQELQLAERDPAKQYKMAADLLEQVPKHIQIVVSPGNHDVVRQALPQPAVGVDMAESMYAMENLRWVGDPAYVKLHGVMFLVYHGKSLDDVIATTPGLAYDRPTEAMRLLLRSRHLAPTYGKRTSLSPEPRDFLVVDPVPDVMHVGHVHTYGELNYRGTVLVNSGTWQGQTSFQVNMGLEPTPSIVPVVNLSSLEVVRRNFGAAGFGA